MKQIDFEGLTSVLPGKETMGQRPQKVGNNTFGDMLASSLSEVNKLQIQADTEVKNLAAGKNENIHETMIAMEKAQVSFRLMMQIRNKILEAYQEIVKTSM